MTASYCNTMWWPLKDSGGTANFFSEFTANFQDFCLLSLFYNPFVVLALAALLALSILTLYHFLSAMLDGPGYVEMGWKPQKAEDEGYLQWCEVRMSCQELFG